VYLLLLLPPKKKEITTEELFVSVKLVCFVSSHLLSCFLTHFCSKKQAQVHHPIAIGNKINFSNRFTFTQEFSLLHPHFTANYFEWIRWREHLQENTQKQFNILYPEAFQRKTEFFFQCSSEKLLLLLLFQGVLL
jgi:hypothetical protein